MHGWARKHVPMMKEPFPLPCCVVYIRSVAAPTEDALLSCQCVMRRHNTKAKLRSRIHKRSLPLLWILIDIGMGTFIVHKYRNAYTSQSTQMWNARAILNRLIPYTKRPSRQRVDFFSYRRFLTTERTPMHTHTHTHTHMCTPVMCDCVERNVYDFRNAITSYLMVFLFFGFSPHVYKRQCTLGSQSKAWTHCCHHIWTVAHIHTHPDIHADAFLFLAVFCWTKK